MFGSYPIIKTPIRLKDEEDILDLAKKYKDDSDMAWVVFDEIEVNQNFLGIIDQVI